MAGNGGSELTPSQSRAIAALLTERTIEEAATVAKVSPRTIYRWLADSAFTSELKAAQARGLADHIRALTTMLAGNRDVMIDIRDDEETPAHVRLRAAKLIEESLHIWRESVDFEERLQRLEEAVNAQ